jgi:hypothetical protein
MKLISRGAIALLMILLSAPLIHGQDLSKYRNFSLGLSLADISKQIDKKPTDATVVHERPALIQQLTWWPPPTFGSSLRADAVQQMRFSFYNGELYRIGVTYDDSATKGLTAADMVQAMSGNYGTATQPPGEIEEVYGTKDKVLARWEDSQYSSNLFRSSLSNAFGLVVFTKQLDAQAAAASTEAVKLEQQEAPQKELARVKKATDDLETVRQKNLKAFRP